MAASEVERSLVYILIFIGEFFADSGEQKKFNDQFMVHGSYDNIIVAECSSTMCTYNIIVHVDIIYSSLNVHSIFHTGISIDLVVGVLVTVSVLLLIALLVTW